MNTVTRMALIPEDQLKRIYQKSTNSFETLVNSNIPNEVKVNLLTKLLTKYDKYSNNNQPIVQGLQKDLPSLQYFSNDVPSFTTIPEASFKSVAQGDYSISDDYQREDKYENAVPQDIRTLITQPLTSTPKVETNVKIGKYEEPITRERAFEMALRNIPGLIGEKGAILDEIGNPIANSNVHIITQYMRLKQPSSRKQKKPISGLGRVMKVIRNNPSLEAFITNKHVKDLMRKSEITADMTWKNLQHLVY